MTMTDTNPAPEVTEPEADDAPAPEVTAPEVTMTQADLDALIAKRLDRERKKWDTDAQAASERAKLDEVDRLKAEKADSDNAVAEAKREALSIRVETTAERLALKAGVKPDRVERFLRNVDLSDLDELTEDGKPNQAALTKLIGDTLADVPEFRGQTAAGASGAEFGGDPAKKVWTRAEIAKLSADDYAKHETEILAQLQGPGIN